MEQIASIGSLESNKRSLRERYRRLTGLVPYLVLAVGIAVSVYGWHETRQADMEAARTRFNQRADRLVADIRTRMQSYEQMLRGGVGLFAASEQVTREEWRNYVAALKLEQTYPGVQAMGVAFRVTADKKAQHIAKVRAEGLTSYSLRPEGERAEYEPVVYIEPLSGRNLLAVGYDLYSEPARREALDRARDSGQAALTAKVILVQEGGAQEQPGCLMYLPIYANNRPIGTVAERRAALVGFVGSPFRMRDLMMGILGGGLPDLDLEVYDGRRTSNEALLYDGDMSLSGTRASRPASLFSRTGVVEVAGRAWTVVSGTRPDFEMSIDQSKPLLVLAGGLALSLLLFVIARFLTRSRLVALRLAQQMTERLRDSEERYMLALRGSNDGLWDWKVNSDEVYFSPRWKEQIGYRDEEIPNRLGEFESRVHSDDWPRVAEAMDAHFKRHLPYNVEFRFRAKNGDYRWIRSRGEAVRDASGAPVRFAGSHLDITEHKASQERIQKLNAELEARVAERTSQLEAANYELQKEVAERMRAEEELQLANLNLESSIASMEQHSHDITLLGELGDLLRTCKTSDEAFEIVTRYGQRMFNADCGGLFMIKPSRNLIDAVAHWGSLPAGDQVFEPDDCWALRRGKLNLDEAGQGGLRCRHVSREINQSALCIPLIAQGETMGILHMRGQPGGAARRSFTDNVHLAEAMAEHVALALASLELRDTLRSQSIRDPLTGLFNRRYMEETMLREERRAVRQGESIGIIMFDIDRFKTINDTYGHVVGDEFLKQLAQVVLRHTRDGDITCRYGGEEFVAILPGASAESTRERAEQVRESVAKLVPQFRDWELPRITLSLGVAAFPLHGATWQEVLQQADRALYRAKQAGRNRVVSVQESVQEVARTTI